MTKYLWGSRAIRVNSAASSLNLGRLSASIIQPEKRVCISVQPKEKVSYTSIQIMIFGPVDTWSFQPIVLDFKLEALNVQVFSQYAILSSKQKPQLHPSWSLPFLTLCELTCTIVEGKVQYVGCVSEVIQQSISVFVTLNSTYEDQDKYACHVLSVLFT